MNILRRLGQAGALALAASLAASAPAAWAQDAVADFYSGKTITLLVGAAPGGAADTYARTFANHFPKHVPGNPGIVVINRPGAGGLIVANELQHTADRDGLVIGTLQRNNFLAPLLSEEDTRFDPREVSHLGSLSRETYVIFSYGADAEVKTIDQVFTTQMTLGGTGASAENVTYPLLVNELLGGQFEIIKGYEGNEQIELAIERGEVDGRASSYGSTLRGNLGRWTEAGLLNLIMQFSIEGDPAIPDVPNVMDRVTDPDHEAIFRLLLLPQDVGRPFAAPPGIPEDRLAALRQAFVDTANDPEFVAELESQQATVELVDGETVQALAEEMMATPPELVERVKELLNEE